MGSAGDKPQISQPVAGRVVTVEFKSVRWSVDDERAEIAKILSNFVDPGCQRADASCRAAAPVTVPHVAGDQRCSRTRRLPPRGDFAPRVAPANSRVRLHKTPGCGPSLVSFT